MAHAQECGALTILGLAGPQDAFSDIARPEPLVPVCLQEGFTLLGFYPKVDLALTDSIRIQ